MNKHLYNLQSCRFYHIVYNPTSVIQVVYNSSISRLPLHSPPEEEVEAGTDRPDHPPHHSGLSKLASVAEGPFPYISRSSLLTKAYAPTPILPSIPLKGLVPSPDHIPECIPVIEPYRSQTIYKTNLQSPYKLLD